MRLHRTKFTWLAMAAIFWLFLGRVGEGDSWGPPTTQYESKNGQYVLDVGWPISKTLTLSKKTPTGKKEELWSRSYVDDTWPPHTAYVADDGQHVVLRDVYHNLGYGKVLVFLGPQGNILRSYELADLLTQDQILDTLQTISSLWWSEPGWFSFLKDQKQFAFVTHCGIMDCFDVATGERVALDEKKRAEIRSRALGDTMPGLSSNESYEKTGAIELCGALKAIEAVPELKSLLANPRSDFQGCAARALISILKAKAVPLIENQLASATPAAREALLDAIAGLDGKDYIFAAKTPDSPFLLATWRRLSQSPLDDVRRRAVEALLLRDNAQFVYDHPAVIKDPEEQVRFSAVCCLVERGDKNAIPLLRTVLRDGNAFVRSRAFCGLVKYEPDDIHDLLREGLKDKNPHIRSMALTALVKRAAKKDIPAVLYQALQDENSDVRWEAMAELLKRGDKEADSAVARFVGEIAALKDHSHDHDGWYSDEWEAKRMCGLVIALKLSAAKPALRQAYANKCEGIRRPVSAALASLGDSAARQDLRRFAGAGDALKRRESIKMLAFIGDTESLPALREALKDREPWVREAAKEAIAELEKKPAGSQPTNQDKQK
jgi:HEAT repeat protein